MWALALNKNYSLLYDKQKIPSDNKKKIMRLYKDKQMAKNKGKASLM
jgi:hypothetical protein